jgi:hypothetical protein
MMKDTTRRAQLPDGTFIDFRGNVFEKEELTDTKVIAHYGPDNVAGILFRYDPNHALAIKESPSSVEIPAPLPPPPFDQVKSRAALEPGKFDFLYKLLGINQAPPPFDTVRVHRGDNEEAVLYRLSNVGGLSFLLTRQFGEHAAQPQLIQGEIILLWVRSEKRWF